MNNVDLSQLLADWERNPVAVIERHQGAVVETTGFVNEVNSIGHQTYLVLAAQEKRDWAKPTVHAFLLSPSLVSQMKDYPVGERITLQISLNQPPDRLLTCVVVKIVPVAKSPVAATKDQSDKKRAKKDVAKVWTRAEFRNLVLGKTADEVIKAVGRPNSTQESGQSLYWYYHDVVRDEITGKLDQQIQVVFSRGAPEDPDRVVVQVNY